MAGIYDHVVRSGVQFYCHRRALFCVRELINVFVTQAKVDLKTWPKQQPLPERKNLCFSTEE